MNKYEQRADQERKASMRFSMTMWTAALALVVVVLLILGLNSGLNSSGGFSRLTPGAAIILAVLLLVFRQLSRRLKTKGSRAAQPDPKSQIKLN